jgi:hypothetical protein
MGEPVRERVFDGRYLRADLTGAGRRVLIVTFDHWRGSRPGFHPVEPPATALEAGHAHLGIATAANDWFLNADLPALKAVLAPLARRFAAVRATGFSMGGYGALLLADALRPDHVTLFSPQVSIRPELVPFETRWRRDLPAIDPTLDRLDLTVPPDLRGVILFDPFYTRAERLHARAIARLAPGIRLAPLPFSGHPPTGLILAGAAFRRLQAASFDGTLDVQTLRRLHVTVRRTWPVYRQRLDEALARRRGGG